MSPLLAVQYLGIDPLLSLYAIVAFIVIGVLLVSMILFTKAKCVGAEECAININQDPSLKKYGLGGSTLLSVLTENGIPVPSPCGGKATCKQCIVQVTEGASEPLETDRATFSKKQLKEGWRLSCQFKVKQDIGVHLDLESMDVEEWEATVISNQNVASFIKELIVEVPKEVPYRSGSYLQFHVPPFKTNTNEWVETIGDLYLDEWKQYEMLDKTIDFSHLPKKGHGEVIRAYSMASYPAEKTKLIFNVRIATPPFEKGQMSQKLPWGICSSYLFSLKPGDKLHLTGPFGESYMIEDERELVFLIGGAGSSFGRSHVLHLFHTEKTKRKVTMWYGARSLKENIYQKEYEELDQQYPNFDYKLVLSEPLPEDFEKGWPKDDPIKTNYLFRAFELGQLSKMEEPEECLYFVCGPPMHNTCVLKLLDDYGVPRENIVLDDFGS